MRRSAHPLQRRRGIARPRRSSAPAGARPGGGGCRPAPQPSAPLGAGLHDRPELRDGHLPPAPARPLGQPGLQLPRRHRAPESSSSATATRRSTTSRTRSPTWPGPAAIELQTQALDEGGWTLQEHLAAPETATTLASEHWDVVVLQEQSQIPSLAVDRTQMMYPAATGLVAEIRAHDAQPMLYLTFAHQDGWPEEGLRRLPDHADGDRHRLPRDRRPAQRAGGAGRRRLGGGGRQASPPALWQSDGSHPTASGTYLAACVFYATIFRRARSGSATTAASRQRDPRPPGRGGRHRAR